MFVAGKEWESGIAKVALFINSDKAETNVQLKYL